MRFCHISSSPVPLVLPPHMPSAHRLLLLVILSVPWLVSLAWLLRTLEALARVGRVPDLLRLPEPRPFRDVPGAAMLSVVVPACNEQEAISATVRSLLASRGLSLQVIAVDDRSTDGTGSLLDALAAEYRGGENTLEVVHITELPPGWLGKPHALVAGTALARAPYLLFTDADILFREDALLRALTFLIGEKLDHLAMAATPVTKSQGERMMLGALQALGVWTLRIWKIGDPGARESLGVGSFSLVRREAYEAVGGWGAFRMEVLEDLRFGWEMKRGHHRRQQIALGKNLLQLHWAAGALGLAHNLTKNGFALFRYRLLPAVGTLLALCLMLAAPFAALGGPAAVRWAFLPFAVALLLLYRRDIGQTGIPLGYVLLFPFGALLLVYALVRSITLTLVRGGVEWRGTLYPLVTLRREAGPLR